MRISGCRIFRYRLPLTGALALAGRVIHEREGVLVRIDSDSGASGWGEVAPLSGLSRESLEDAESELAAVGARLRGTELHSRGDDLESWPELGSAGAASPSVRFGLETALANLSARVERGADADLPCFDGAVPVSGLLAGSRTQVLAHAGGLRDRGYCAVKLKVGMRPVPVPDEEFGQRCVAFVRRRGMRSGAVELAAWLRRTLPRYKVPDRFYEWPHMDREIYKVDRARFCRLALEARTGMRLDRADA